MVDKQEIGIDLLILLNEELAVKQTKICYGHIIPSPVSFGGLSIYQSSTMCDQLEMGL